jgi:hypothetical protein
MSFITLGDFTGKFTIVTNGYKSSDIQEYIDLYEKSYLVNLLGLELYDLFIIGMALPIPDPIYVKIYDALFYQDCELIESKGIKKMLLGFIYFQWCRDEKVQQTINGAIKIKSELSERAGNQNSNIFGRYNDSIETYQNIQKYINLNLDIYPTFKGIEKGFAYITW